MTFAGLRDFASAVTGFAQLQTIMRDMQFTWGEAMCEWWLGICTTYNGKFDSAREHCSKSLAKFEALDDFS
jgi:hypothetical protein